MLCLPGNSALAAIRYVRILLDLSPFCMSAWDRLSRRSFVVEAAFQPIIERDCRKTVSPANRPRLYRFPAPPPALLNRIDTDWFR